ncbi:hypothetical protein [Nocardiopsis suaedae]|uniref:DUF3558 domain-containing protein n=1 Tax=Nocardiopsis suaedae TaxID=3018444 RepID=A0ABT4TJ67_9ACTN|nr:hypothetical protein [Nocardiopsis suaedae]MDA2804716.1 hypothetical protein [Nocardiopsis suaedae]
MSMQQSPPPPGPPGPPFITPPPPPEAVQPPPASRPGGASRWVALGAGVFMLALVVVTGVVVVTAAVGGGGAGAPAGGAAAETGAEGGTGGETSGREDGADDGAGDGDGDGDGTGGADEAPGAGTGEEYAPDPHEGVAAYTGPDTPTQVAVGPGPYRLPADACSGVGPQTLEGLGMGEEPTRSESSEGAAPSRSCMWQQLADDGSFHVLRIRYQSADAPESAAALYRGAAEEQAGILGDVVQQEAPGIGDESTVVLVDNGDGAYQGVVFIRLQNTVVTVEREIQPPAGGTDTPTLAWGPTGRLMPELGRQALNNLV